MEIPTGQSGRSYSEGCRCKRQKKKKKNELETAKQ